MQWCLGIMALSLQVFQPLKGSQAANQHLINTKGHPFSLPAFISIVIFPFSEMETVDLSKPSLWTVCILLLAPQQV